MHRNACDQVPKSFGLPAPLYEKRPLLFTNCSGHGASVRRPCHATGSHLSYTCVRRSDHSAKTRKRLSYDKREPYWMSGVSIGRNNLDNGRVDDFQAPLPSCSRLAALRPIAMCIFRDRDACRNRDVQINFSPRHPCAKCRQSELSHYVLTLVIL
jgi:hypothetical protein